MCSQKFYDKIAQLVNFCYNKTSYKNVKNKAEHIGRVYVFYVEKISNGGVAWMHVKEISMRY